MNQEQIELELLKAKAQAYDALAMRENAEARLERANTRVKELIQMLRDLPDEAPAGVNRVAELVKGE